MSEARYSIGEQPSSRHPLAKGARPEAIRAALLPEDQLEFDRALAGATDELKATLDLVPLFAMLDQWRRIAALQSDPERFARVARRAAALNTGQEPPGDVTLAALRDQAGMQPASVYEIVTHGEARAQLDELPTHLAAGYLEARAALETSPWTVGRSTKPTNPDANIYALDVGGDVGGDSDDVIVYYAIVERDREVHILEVLWL